MFKGVFDESIIKRAKASKKLKVVVHNLRDWSCDKHRKVDDKPYGGGPGMVLSCQPIFDAVRDLKAGSRGKGLGSRVILLCPQGKKLKQKLAKRLSKEKHLILICGHYEGVDERVRQYLVDEEISIGDYVLTGGELPAMVLVDAIVRLIPGVLGDKNSLHFESFEGNLLEYPQYTRPAKFREMYVPSVLLSGDHKKIQIWRKKEALKRTKERRPDLLSCKRSDKNGKD